MSSTLTPQQKHKKQLREQMRAKRMAHHATNSNSDKLLADVFLRNVKLEGDEIIASYQAFRGEMDGGALIAALRARGHNIALPVILHKRAPLIFRLHQQDIPLVANSMGIFEPDATALTVEPDILLVPLLAFDRNLNRLGYGGGFYDRTIAELRKRKSILAVGLAYGFQEIPQVPVDANDVKLDKIVTEINVF